MTRNRIFLIVALSALLLFFLGSQFYEYKEVPDVNWRQNYNFESKEPYGGWMFENMLSTRFDSVELVYHHKDTLITEIDTSGVLLVKLGDFFTTRDEEVEELTTSSKKEIRSYI